VWRENKADFDKSKERQGLLARATQHKIPHLDQRVSVSLAPYNVCRVHGLWPPCRARTHGSRQPHRTRRSRSSSRLFSSAIRRRPRSGGRPPTPRQLRAPMLPRPGGGLPLPRLQPRLRKRRQPRKVRQLQQRQRRPMSCTPARRRGSLRRSGLQRTLRRRSR
jgi:hypothetical protein